MDHLAAGSDSATTKVGHRWIWPVAVTALMAVLFVVLFGLGRIVALFQLYWSPDSIQRLFYEDIGLSQSWSAFIGIVGSFFLRACLGSFVAMDISNFGVAI
jgi:hypothetical protein